MSRRSAPLLLLLATLLAAACRTPASAAGEKALLDAEWTGAATAKMSGPATAEWCDSLRLLQIQALRGDTGVAIAIFPVGRFEAGRFTVVPAARADSIPPAAAVAIRWFAETSIKGFQGDSGNVVVQESRPGVYAGTFEARAHSVTDTGHLSVRGSFRGLTVRAAVRGCTARRHPADSSARVH